MAVHPKAFELAEAEASARPTFKKLSAAEVMQLYDAGDAVLVALKEQYADVFADPEHPRRASVALRVRIEGEIIPAVQLAWQNGDRVLGMSEKDMLNLPYEDLLAYARQVRAANPFLEHLPEPDDPNPTPAAS